MKPVTQPGNKTPPANDIVKKEVTEPANLDVSKVIQQQLAIVPPLVDSSVGVKLAMAPVKKKLKVVHINELGDPEETSNTARYSEHHSFQLKLINPEVYSISSLPSNSIGFNIFKSKNPFSN